MSTYSKVVKVAPKSPSGSPRKLIIQNSPPGSPKIKIKKKIKRKSSKSSRF